jgi:hypothetical protein
MEREFGEGIWKGNLERERDRDREIGEIGIGK